MGSAPIGDLKLGGASAPGAPFGAKPADGSAPFGAKPADGGSASFLKPAEKDKPNPFGAPAAGGGVGFGGLSLGGSGGQDGGKKERPTDVQEPDKSKRSAFGAPADNKPKEESKAAAPGGGIFDPKPPAAAADPAKPADGTQVSEAPKITNDKAAQDEAFKSKPFHHVVDRWQKNIQRNEKEFNDAVENLREYELLLV